MSLSLNANVMNSPVSLRYILYLSESSCSGILTEGSLQ